MSEINIPSDPQNMEKYENYLRNLNFSCLETELESIFYLIRSANYHDDFKREQFRLAICQAILDFKSLNLNLFICGESAGSSFESSRF